MLIPLLTLSILASPAIPTPGMALMINTSPQVLTQRLLAQADTEPQDSKAVEDELEADMDRARRHIRAGEGEPPPPPAEAEPLPDPAPAIEAAPPYEPPRAAPPPSHETQPTPQYQPPPESHVFDARREGAKPTIDGDGKVHYLVWSIVDWSIAGGMWTGAVICALVGGALLATASGAWMTDLNEVGGVLYLAAFAGLAAGGGLVAWRAMLNVDNYKLLKAREKELGF